jgi:nucleoid DNA-binding protein
VRRELRRGLAGYNAAADRVAVNVAAQGLTKKQTLAVIEAWAAELVATTKKKKRLGWPGVGVFYIRETKARTIRSPQPPHDLVSIASTWALAFRASQHQKGKGTL